MTHGVLAPQGPTFTSRAMVSGSRRRSSAPWVRPADWLALTTPDPSEQKVVGLYAVHEYTFTTAVVRCTGAFTVDWGDGAGPVNYASNTNAEKVLSWSDYSSATLTGDGFRQAVITVAPQAGQTITFCDFSRRHSAVPQLDSSQWLDIRVSLPSGDFRLVGDSPQRYARVLQSFTAVTPVSGYHLFRECVSLRDIHLVGLLGTNFANMYYNCYSATEFPVLDTSLGTNFSYMYSGCVSATAFPALDTSLGTNFSNMYTSCVSATAFPALDTSLGTNFSNMHQSCISLGRSLITGTRYSISYASTPLSATEINAIFTRLGTAAGTQTITVTGTPGAATCTPSIATSKGWTVAA